MIKSENWNSLDRHFKCPFHKFGIQSLTEIENNFHLIMFLPLSETVMEWIYVSDELTSVHRLKGKFEMRLKFTLPLNSSILFLHSHHVAMIFIQWTLQWNLNIFEALPSVFNVVLEDKRTPLCFCHWFNSLIWLFRHVTEEYFKNEH